MGKYNTAKPVYGCATIIISVVAVAGLIVIALWAGRGLMEALWPIF